MYFCVVKEVLPTSIFFTISSATAGIFQFELVHPVERGLGIIGNGHFEFAADISDHIHIGIHIEIQSAGFPGRFGQGRILNILTLVSGQDINISLGPDINFTISE